MNYKVKPSEKHIPASHDTGMFRPNDSHKSVIKKMDSFRRSKNAGVRR